jgi:hypothetical protein
VANQTITHNSSVCPRRVLSKDWKPDGPATTATSW